MARDYGRISTQFWNHPKIRGCSDQAKLLATYLVSGPHSNACGAYLLPDAYVADDMGWSSGTVSKAFAELFKIGFAARFGDGRHIVICDFLEWNPVENENVGKAIMKQIAALPDDPALEFIFNGLKPYAKHFPNGLETLSKRYAKQFRNIEPEPKPEPKPDPEPEQDLARSADADAREAFDAYNTVAEETGWPIAQHLTDKRKRLLALRMGESGGLQGWRAAMAKAKQSPFLRGDAGRDKDHQGWAPDLDFFLQQSSFTKLMEGKYDQRGRVQSSGFDALREGASRAAGLDRECGQGVEASPDPLQRLALSVGTGTAA